MELKSQLSNLITDFASAWRLLTIIPLPFLPVYSRRSAGRAAGYYPLVGLILGGLLAGAGQLLNLFLPNGLAAALLLALWAGLTGLLHLDGFMDSCDGLLPPRDPARRLEIMKDSRVGAFGVIGLVLLLLVKFNALASLPPGSRVAALLVISMLARWAMTWVMGRYPLARQEGLGVFFGIGLGWPQVVGASVMAVVGSFIFMSWFGLLLVGVTWLIATLMARLAMVRISGLTGDVYGAICEIVEAALLTVVVGVGG